MKTNPLKEGALTENSVGIGTVTRKMVKERAIELAITDDRTAQEVSPADWQQAKQELSGRPDLDPKAAMLESAPELERWDLSSRFHRRKKCPWLPAKTKMTKVAAIMKSWLMRAWPKRSSITISRLPKMP